MKILRFISLGLLTTAVCACLGGGAIYALDVPPPPAKTAILDQAGIIDDAAEASLSQAETAVSEALARHDQALLVVQMARVDEARARLEQAREDQERSRVLAPMDGLVVDGDLSRSVGAPVRRGEVLMTVAPASFITRTTLTPAAVATLPDVPT